MRRIDDEPATNSNGHPRDPDGAAPAPEPATLADVVRELRGVRKAIVSQRKAIATRDAELLDAKATALFLGVGKTKLYQMAALDDRLKPVNLPGGGKRWRRANLQAFVDAP